MLIDLDGTLIDSVGNLYNIYLEFLKAHNIEGNAEEFALLNGPTISEAIVILKSKYDLREDHHILLANYMAIIDRNYSQSKPFDDAELFLSTLYDAGVKLILVTSGIRSKSMSIIQHHGWDHYFSDFVFGDDVKKSKPNPEIYLKAIKKSGEKAEDCLAVEDSYNGVSAAIGAALNVYAVHNKIAEATESFDTLGDICDYLKKTNHSQMMIIRQATAQDSDDIFNWRNDPLTRSMSIHGQAVTKQSHQDWFEQSLKNTHRIMMVGELENNKVGICRFDIDEEKQHATISINLNPSIRGRGLSSDFLMQCIFAFWNSHAMDIKATIKKNNIASIKCFEKVGFKELNSDENYSHYKLTKL